MSEPFKGVIKLDVRDSTPDWTPYTLKHAPEGAPNILFVLYDDTGSGRVVAVRRPHQHADAGPAGRQRPDLLAVAHDGAVLADPLDAPDRTQPPPQRLAAITEGANGFPGRSGRIPPSARTIGTDPAGQRLQHLLARQEPQRARSGHRLAAASRRVAAAKGLRPLLRLPRRRDQPVVSRPRRRQPFHRPALPPGRGLSPLQGPGRPGAQDAPRPAVSQPVEALVHVVLPRRQPRAAPRPQEYIDKYKGKFDDGYEAYREWVLPRMIEEGILPEGTELTPINPMPEDVAQRGRRRCGPGARSTTTRRSCSPAWPRCTPASPNTPTCRSAASSITWSDRPARQHHHLLLRRQRRVRRRQPERLGQREQVLQWLPGRARGEHEATSTSSAARTPTTTTRPAGRWRSRTPFKMFKRYSQYAGGTCDPLVISWPKGIKAQGRSAQPVPPLDRHRADDPRRRRAGDAEGLPRRRAVSAAPACRCATRFDDAEAPTQKQRQYYAMLGTRGIWEDGWKAVARPRADQRHGPFRQGRVGAVPRRRRPLRSRRTWPRSIRRNSSADRDLVRRGRARTTCCRSTTARAIEHHHARASAGASRRATRYIYYPGTAPVPESVAVNIRGRSYKILADVEITEPNARA